MNTKQIIANLVDKGYRQAKTTMASLANFWRAADNASDYLNRKNQSTPVFTKSVPTRSNRPKMLRVSFIVKTTQRDGTSRDFFLNDFDVPLNITKGELDQLAYDHAMSVLGNSGDHLVAYISYTSIIAV